MYFRDLEVFGNETESLNYRNWRLLVGFAAIHTPINTRCPTSMTRCMLMKMIVSNGINVPVTWLGRGTLFTNGYNIYRPNPRLATSCLNVCYLPRMESAKERKITNSTWPSYSRCARTVLGLVHYQSEAKRAIISYTVKTLGFHNTAQSLRAAAFGNRVIRADWVAGVGCLVAFEEPRICWYQRAAKADSNNGCSLHFKTRVQLIRAFE